MEQEPTIQQLHSALSAITAGVDALNSCMVPADKVEQIFHLKGFLSSSLQGLKEKIDASEKK